MIVISLLAFGLSSWAPIDPVQKNCPTLEAGKDPRDVQACIERNRKAYGLDLPLFYLELTTQAAPDTLYRIYPKEVRQNLARFTHQSGNWPAVENYHQSIEELKAHLALFVPDTARLDTTRMYQAKRVVAELLATSTNLLRLYQSKEIKLYLGKMMDLSIAYPFLDTIRPEIEHVLNAWEQIEHSPKAWKAYVPKLIWHGTDNQYHHWISKVVLELDFGRSYITGDRVSDKLRRAFMLSFIFPLLSILLAYLLALPVGMLSARYPNGWWDRISGTLVWILDALPTFLLMTLLLAWLGHSLGWFPVSFEASESHVGAYLHQMILPLVGYTYGALALLSRTMRAGLLDVMQQDYIRTARAKGLSPWLVMRRHAMRNALIPLITLFVGIFPALIGGSVVIEHIFNIPGMGSEILRATLDNDMPVVVMVFTLTGFLTALGYLVADLLYNWADPRIRFDA